FVNRLQSEIKFCPFSRLGFEPYSSSMFFDDLFRNGQPDPRSFEFRLVMQLSENDKYLLRILLLDAYAVVFHREQPSRIPFGGCYSYKRLPSFFSEFNGIADQVLE